MAARAAMVARAVLEEPVWVIVMPVKTPPEAQVAPEALAVRAAQVAAVATAGRPVWLEM
jgi:hypothetical protein